jgi:peptide chain release factor 2
VFLFVVDVLDAVRAEQAGMRSVTMLIRGEFASGWLHGETGVHRLIRMSPFNSPVHSRFISW